MSTPRINGFSNSWEQRLGWDAFIRRKYIESKMLRCQTPLSKHRKFARWKSKTFFLGILLRFLGLYQKGYRQYLDVRVVEREVRLRILPRAFDGFRLLQLSDLHFTLSEDFTGALLAKLATASQQVASCDAAVFTGDYCAHLGKHHSLVLKELKSILEALKLPCWGVLGNYDLLALVPDLEKSGLRILLNEHEELRRGRERIFLCGVDDPALFGTEDLIRARHGISPKECTILLAHSPHVAKEAAALGYSWMLSGHTHGGQVCLPGGRPIINKTHVSSALMRGAWQEGDLLGYTSPGTGASQLPVRLNCPGEITIHILRRG